MADPEHVAWLKSGHRDWNARRSLVQFEPDLTNLDFRDEVPDYTSARGVGFFKRFNFSNANMRGTTLAGLDFSSANFSNANLSKANLENGNFRNAKFRRANLSYVNAGEADFGDAALKGANFEGANLSGAILGAEGIRIANLSSEQQQNVEIRVAGEVHDRPIHHVRISAKDASGEVSKRTLEADAMSANNRGRYLVLYGTNRKPKLTRNAVVGFGYERDDKLNLGSCEVFIPESHKIGSLGSSIWKRAIRGDDRVRIRKLVSLNGELYWQLVKDSFAADEGACPPTIFIHGYNTKFADAVKRAAQIGFDLGLNAGISLFSWPSFGSASKYSADEASVEASKSYLVEFILKYLDTVEGVGLNVIAHSMGCRCLVSALETIGLTHPQKLPLINQIVLAAADVDQDVMDNLSSHLIQNSGRTTSYTSTSDKPLKASGWLHSFPRVGFLPPVYLLNEMDTVEVEKTNLIGLGHSYVADAKPVLNDMFNLIVNSLPPSARFSVKRVGPINSTHWKLVE